MKKYILPAIGDMQLSEVIPKHVREIIDKITSNGHKETARKVRQYISQVCNAAIQVDHISLNPADPLKGYVKKSKNATIEHFAYTINPKKISHILKSVSGYTGSDSAKYALMIAPHVMLRPSELRNARWCELNFNTAKWTIPAHRMKVESNGNHIVPLSKQVIRLFKELQQISYSDDLCFPGLRDIDRPISDNTLNAALRRLDIPKDLQTTHGWRHTASTLLNEVGGYNQDYIEVQLHHSNSSIRGQYNHAQHMEQRQAMMQSWSDYLCALESGKKNVTLKIKQLSDKETV